MRRIAPLLCLAALHACDESDDTTPKEPITPVEFEAPDPCDVYATPEPLCEYEALAKKDAKNDPPMEIDPGMGGAGGMGGATSGGEDDEEEEEDPPLDPTAQCLISEDVTVTCPTRLSAWSMARGPNDELALALSRIGKDGRDDHAVAVANDQAYVQILRYAPDGDPRVTRDELEPAKNLSVLLVPGSDSSELLRVVRSQPGDEPPGALTIEPLLGGTPLAQLDLSEPRLPFTSAFVGSSGRITFAEFSAAAGLFVTTGLPESPRTISLTGRRSYALDETASGELRLLTHDASSLRLLGGPDLEDTLWATEASLGANLPSANLVHVTTPGLGEVAVALTRNGDTDGYQIRIITSEGEGSQTTTFGHSFEDCPNFSIGIICDECPAGQRCKVQKDLIWNARLFVADGRVFVAYVATDRIDHLEVKRNITSIGLGCTCTTSEVGSEETADYLIVHEVEIRTEPVLHPRLAPRMRRPIAGARYAEATIFSPNAGGTLDLAFGPRLHPLQNGQNSFPQDPLVYRVLRIAPFAH